MTGFSFNGNQTSDSLITNDGFFPDIRLDHVRKSLRFDGSVTNERLFDAVVNSVLEVNQQLLVLKTKKPSFSELATTTVAGQSNVEMLYLRAVYASVAAMINEHYRSYDSTGDSQKRAEEMNPVIDEHRRNLRWAIRDLLGISRCTVDLI